MPINHLGHGRLCDRDRAKPTVDLEVERACRQPGARHITGYVLGKFDSTEAGLIDKVLNVACDQAECWFTAGIQKAMSQFNGAVDDGLETKREAK